MTGPPDRSPISPRICAFCGSRSGARSCYEDAATEVGDLLGRAGVGLVYGGGRTGLMGRLADASLAVLGDVVGIIPEHLTGAELAHAGLSELIIVKSMHERKALMASRSDAFLALPGGIGTFEEFFEILTWWVLNLHRKPIAILNVQGYYDALLALLDHAVAEDFFRADHRDTIRIFDRARDVEAWIRREVRVQPHPPDDLSGFT